MSRAALALAFVRARLLRRVLRDRAAITRWQDWNIERLRRHALAKAAFYRRLGDAPFSAFPVVSKADVMGEFEAFNTLGLSAAAAWRMIERGDAPPGHDLGCSTGTSGNRGLYLVSDRERFVWLGNILARAVPDVLRRRHRVAIVLPRASRLYDTANESRLLTLKFCDLRAGLDSVRETLAAFRPTILVGPPRALRWLAESHAPIAPERVFYCAEVLDAPDTTAIEAAFGVRPGQIYMATEGLFAVTCEMGALHLAEDVVRFEFEQTGDDGLVAPVVTDFTRRTQILARYRMNDLLRLDPRRCACGCAFQVVAEIVGRADDAFVLPARDGRASTVTITPDILRNAILDADGRIDDFRLRQTGENDVRLALPSTRAAEAAEKAVANLRLAFAKAGARPEIVCVSEIPPQEPATKLRRVENRWKPRGP